MYGPETGSAGSGGASGGRPGPARRRATARGVSIIEVMVGMVVATLVGLAAAGSAIVFSVAQRQGVGVGGSGLTATLSLSVMKNDVAQAGLGFFGDANYLCQNLRLSVGATTVQAGTAFAPVQITTEATGDRIDVVYAERVESGANVLLDAPSDGSQAALMSLLPATAGQAVLLAPANGVGTCLVRSITQVTSSTETTPQLLDFGLAGLHNQVAFSPLPYFNERDRVALLSALNWSRWRRTADNTLVLERPLQGTSAVVARQVIGLRAQYGLSAVGSNTLESWQNASGAFASLDANNLPQVRAVRLGIVTRSLQRERPDAAGVCQASLTKPVLFGSTVEPDVSDWRCFRYSVAVVVVPMRNLVMGLTP